MSAILKGSTEKCFAHLMRALGEDTLEERNKIAVFVGVENQTVRRWVNGPMKPVGESLIRLRFYLEFLGYQVEELESLEPPVRDTARIYAFQIVSLTEIADIVGYPNIGRIGIDMLLRIFRGKAGFTEKKRQGFVALVELYKDKLPERQLVAPKILIPGSKSDNKLKMPPAREVISPHVTSLQKSGSQKPMQGREAIIESLAGSVKALIPLARALSSDEFTAEERARLRDLTGGNGVFTLANLLFRLCGERAREMHPTTSNQQGATS